MEFCPAELAGRVETTTGATHALIADALDTRHRLPRLWEMIDRGHGRVWRVREVAQATRHLALDAANAVDTAVAGSIATLPWVRFETLLDATIIEAHPVLADRERQRWEADRFVRAGRTRNGLRTVVARALAGDVLLHLAMIDRMAEILAARGDTDTADVRRSKALGVLAQPALALQLLYDHRDDVSAQTLPDEFNGRNEPDGSGLVIEPSPVDPGQGSSEAGLLHPCVG